MENKNGRSKKNVGGVLLDILTIGMLFASLAALFYSGFILQTDTFPIGALCAITAVGLLLLFFIGDVSCLASKVKNHSLTAGFLAFSALQLIALIVNLALLLAIMVNRFVLESKLYLATLSQFLHLALRWFKNISMEDSPSRAFILHYLSSILIINKNA